jgi:hypothetical protein
MNIAKKILLNILVLSLITNIYANEAVQINGNFLSVFNAIYEKDQPKNVNKRTQFDVAGNLDVTWNISSSITGVFQLQSSAGEGSFGFNTNQVALTDINLHILFSNEFALTAGSFDTPFGAQTANLTNNADATNNPLILNSLFYSAFAGTNVGTLNTIGGMLDFSWNNFKSTLALTNGTDESAYNPDGKFEIVGNIGYHFGDLLFLSTSLLFSDDTSASGGAGLATKLEAMMIDGSLQPTDNIKFSGYIGELTFDDKIKPTKDAVRILMAEGICNFTPDFYVAARLSMWAPEDEDGSGDRHSKHLVLPGFKGTFGSNTANPDQHVNRMQIGFGYKITDKLQLKSELFIEDYKRDNNITGLILALNASF